MNYKLSLIELLFAVCLRGDQICARPATFRSHPIGRSFHAILCPYYWTAIFFIHAYHMTLKIPYHP